MHSYWMYAPAATLLVVYFFARRYLTAADRRTTVTTGRATPTPRQDAAERAHADIAQFRTELADWDARGRWLLIGMSDYEKVEQATFALEAELIGGDLHAAADVARDALQILSRYPAPEPGRAETH